MLWAWQMKVEVGDLGEELKRLLQDVKKRRE